MKHVGSITDIHGYDLEQVDVVCGGSPCQDLSVAGKRAGLAGARSGLFMEQMRIIKEQLYGKEVGGTDVPVRNGRVRFSVWENVPGALSSPGGDHKGEDFAAVIEEHLKILYPGLDVHIDVPKHGWPKAGAFIDSMGRCSLAWRVHDAQYWGVPQRRRRISLVMDTRGISAPKILFECARVQWHPQTCRQAREATAGDTAESTGESEPGLRIRERGCNRVGDDSRAVTLKIRGGVAVDSGGKAAGKGPLVQDELSGTLCAAQDQTLFCYSIDEKMGNTYIKEDQGNTLAARDYKQPQAVAYAIGSYDSNAWKSGNPNSGVYETEVAKTIDSAHCGKPDCHQGGTVVIEGNGARPLGASVYDLCITGDVAATLTANTGTSGTHSGPTVLQPIGADMYSGDITGDKSMTLCAACADPHHMPTVLIEMTSTKNTVVQDGVCPTLTARMGTGGNQVNAILDERV